MAGRRPYEPVVESVPGDLSERLEQAEIFHEILEHRYFLAQRLEREVSNEEALADYVGSVLTSKPTERQLLADSTDVSPPANLDDLERSL